MFIATEYPRELKVNHQQRVALRHGRASRGLAASLLVLIIVASPAAAQEFRGSIAGRVTDTMGALVPGAQVKVINPATNISNTTTTDEAGSYSLPYLAVGRYSV